jgi:predicted RNA binding protein YcfA (HicA-like mRNA interferase family)
MGKLNLTFRELVDLLVENGFELVRENGSKRFYAKEGHENVIQVHYHGNKQVPTGTLNQILRDAGLK